MARLISQSHGLCVETFRRLCMAAADSEQYPQDFQLAVLDEFDKYKIWSGNLGASHSGRTYKLSLDYRLREATFYKDQVMSIIDILQKHVSTLKESCTNAASTKANYTQVESARQIVSGERKPFEEFSESESDQESVDSSCEGDELFGKGYDSSWDSSSESDYMPEFDPSKDRFKAPDNTSGLLPPATELAQLLEAIKLTIRSLYKLPIRKPAPVDRLKGNLTDTISCFQPFDCMYVRDKFPRLSLEVANRIASHITRRRQLLSYRQEHQELLRPKELQNELGNAPISTGSQIAIKQHPSNAEEEPSSAQLHHATASQPESKPQTFKSKATTFVRSEEQPPWSSVLSAPSVAESISKTSMAASQITQETPVEVPPRPKDLKGTSKTMFECRFCALTTHIGSDRAWKKHVLSDLQPYICTFPQCDLGDHMFANRDAWFQHEILTHRVEYYCNTEAHWTYRNLSEFMDHMQQEHDISLADLVKPAAMNMFKHPVSSTEGICNLCFREQPVRDMKSHVSKHLEQVSLFAIPRAEYGADDADTGENQSHQAQHNLEESIFQDDEEESISQDHEEESVSQDHEQESVSGPEKYDGNPQKISLAQHAAQSQGGIPENHSNAVPRSQPASLQRGIPESHSKALPPIQAATTLDQYASSFQGGILETHSEAFPYSQVASPLGQYAANFQDGFQEDHSKALAPGQDASLSAQYPANYHGGILEGHSVALSPRQTASSLEQYAANFQGGILEANADAFDLYSEQRQPPRQSNHGHYHSPYPAYGPSIPPRHRSAQPHHSEYHNPIASTYDTYLAVPQTTGHRHESTSTSTATVNHHIGLPLPPSSAGHPSPEQPRHPRLPRSSSSSSYFCCGRSYYSKYTFTRHRRESRTCPHGIGGRPFVCFICANTDQPFGRRATLKQHVQEDHGRSPEEANLEVDTWYGRYGEEKDDPDPDVMRGLE